MEFIQDMKRGTWAMMKLMFLVVVNGAKNINFTDKDYLWKEVVLPAYQAVPVQKEKMSTRHQKYIRWVGKVYDVVQVLGPVVAQNLNELKDNARRFEENNL